MAKTKFEEMFDRLPSNIKETEVLRLQSKKVLAALLELLLHSEARESRIIYCQNARLRKLSGIGSNELLPSLQQLIDYDLITRKVGTARKEGEASEYVINFKKLKEPIVERTFDDLFSQFCEEPQSLEKPISTPITTTITTTITTPSSIKSSTTSSIKSSTPNTTTKLKEDMSSSITEEEDITSSFNGPKSKGPNTTESKDLQEALKATTDTEEEEVDEEDRRLIESGELPF